MSFLMFCFVLFSTDKGTLSNIHKWQPLEKWRIFWHTWETHEKNYPYDQCLKLLKKTIICHIEDKYINASRIQIKNW